MTDCLTLAMLEEWYACSSGIEFFGTLGKERVTATEMVAALADNPDWLVWLTAHWPGPMIAAGADVNAKGDGGWTPLHHAACGGHTEIAAALLDAGADVNAKGDGGWTPLHHAACGEHAEAVTTLLDAGADVNARDDDGWTPVHWAAIWAHTDIVRVLIAAGADVNAEDDAGWTALCQAVRNGHDYIADLLRENGGTACK